MKNRSPAFWFLQGPGWLLFAYLVYAQAIPAIDYDLGVRMGTQESAGQITEVGAAFWYGFAFGEPAYWTVLPLITLWGAWGLWQISREHLHMEPI